MPIPLGYRGHDTIEEDSIGVNMLEIDSAANLLEVVGNKRVSVFKDEAEVVVVEVRMGIGNKASFCIVGNIADVEGMGMEGKSLDIGILGIGGWDFDIVEVERNRCA
ncbi:hypothetical protein TNCV_3293081 [Trichonephila clavipes]|nr:hypothetical protein TNCV_3293081 [Trichonephila clavipes]